MKSLTFAAFVLSSAAAFAGGDVFMDAGDIAPQFEGDWYNHSDTSLEELRGHVVLLDVWRTWCGPCTAQIPHLNKLHEEFADRGLKVVGITTEGNGLVERHIEKYRMAFPVAIVDGDEEERLGIKAFPTSFLIDADGVIVWRGHPGRFEQQVGHDKLEKLLAATSTLPDVSGQHRRVARHVDKGKLGKAWEEACDELEDGESPELAELRERLEGMAKGMLAKAEACCDEGRHGQAAAILDDLMERFDGMPEADEAEAMLDGIEGDDAAEDDIEAYEDYVKALGRWREGKFEKALDDLREIIDDYPDTGTALLADAILIRHDT